MHIEWDELFTLVDRPWHDPEGVPPDYRHQLAALAGALAALVLWGLLKSSEPITVHYDDWEWRHALGTVDAFVLGAMMGTGAVAALWAYVRVREHRDPFPFGPRIRRYVDRWPQVIALLVLGGSMWLLGGLLPFSSEVDLPDGTGYTSTAHPWAVVLIVGLVVTLPTLTLAVCTRLAAAEWTPTESLGGPPSPEWTERWRQMEQDHPKPIWEDRVP